MKPSPIGALAALVLPMLVPAVHGASFATGYTKGSSSQLLVANGGAGDVLFNDSAALGGNQDPTDSTGTAAFNSVLLPGTGNWSIGDTISITGVAFVIKNGTATGTFTIDIRQGAGGSGASGAGGLSSIATRTVSYTSTGSNEVMWANFDTPISFVADANSTTIGINFTNDGGTINYKAGTDLSSNGLVRYNYSNGNIVGGATPSYQHWSIAGSVTPVPESSVALLGALGCLALLRRRR